MIHLVELCCARVLCLVYALFFMLFSATLFIYVLYVAAAGAYAALAVPASYPSNRVLGLSDVCYARCGMIE